MKVDGVCKTIAGGSYSSQQSASHWAYRLLNLSGPWLLAGYAGLQQFRIFNEIALLLSLSRVALVSLYYLMMSHFIQFR